MELEDLEIVTDLSDQNDLNKVNNLNSVVQNSIPHFSPDRSSLIFNLNAKTNVKNSNMTEYVMQKDRKVLHTRYSLKGVLRIIMTACTGIV